LLTEEAQWIVIETVDVDFSQSDAWRSQTEVCVVVVDERNCDASLPQNILHVLLIHAVAMGRKGCFIRPGCPAVLVLMLNKDDGTSIRDLCTRDDLSVGRKVRCDRLEILRAVRA
jgi:hypothetical protein